MQFFSNFALWLILFVILGRFQEIFPVLNPLQLGKVSVALGLAMALSTNAKDIGILLRDSPIKIYLIIMLTLAILGVPFSVYRSSALTDTFEYMRLLLSSAVVVALGYKRKQSLLLCLTCIILFLSTQMLLQKTSGRISVSGTYDPNDIALLCITFLPFAIYNAIYGSIITKIIALMASGGGIASVALSGSRGGLIALSTVALYTIIITKKKRLLLITLTVIGGSLFMAMAGDALWVRLNSLISGTDYNLADSGSGRMNIWANGIKLILMRPFFGVGIGQFSTGLGTLTGGPWKTAHNTLIQIGGDLGLLGLYAFCAILFFIYRLSKQGERAPFLSSKEQSLYIFLRISLLGFCVGSFFLSHAYSFITYALFCTAVILYLTLERAQKQADKMQHTDKNNITTTSHNENHAHTYRQLPPYSSTHKPSTKVRHVQAANTRALRKARLEAGDSLHNKMKNK